MNNRNIDFTNCGNDPVSGIQKYSLFLLDDNYNIKVKKNITLKVGKGGNITKIVIEQRSHILDTVDSRDTYYDDHMFYDSVLNKVLLMIQKFGGDKELKSLSNFIDLVELRYEKIGLK